MSIDPTEYPFFFTWSAQRSAKPFAVKSGRGSTVIAEDGTAWLDLGSLSYQANLGHQHPTVISAIQEQAGRLCMTSPKAIFPEKADVAKSLLELAPPGFSKVFFTLGGSEAIENAIKIARLATGRHKLVSRYRSYHGATLGAVTLSGDWRRAPVEPGIVGVVHVLDLDREGPQSGAGTQIPRVLELEGDVGAVVLEPIVGANGVLIPPSGYFRAVREACTAHGALLIVDEVLTGFGRTGKMFAFEHFDDVVPDLIVLGKALTGGYAPLGAVLVHEKVAQTFDDRVLAAGLTHYGHPLGVAAAKASLSVYRDQGLVARAASLGDVLNDALNRWSTAFPKIAGAARCRGLLGALDLCLSDDGWAQLTNELKQRRVLVHVQRPVNALILAPPLNIDEAELADGLKLVEESLAATASAFGPKG